MFREPPLSNAGSFSFPHKDSLLGAARLEGKRKSPVSNVSEFTIDLFHLAIGNRLV